MFEHYLVPLRPFSINGLLGDEAVAPSFLVLVDPVHPALLHAPLLVVMVRDQAAVLLTAKYQKLKSNSFLLSQGQAIDVHLTCSGYR